MMKIFFVNQTGIDNNSNIKISDDKELIDLTEKKIIKNKLNLNRLMNNVKKGTGFMNMFDERKNSDPVKMKCNWITN